MKKSIVFLSVIMTLIIALSFSAFASEAEEIEATEEAEEVVSVVFTPSSNDTTESIEVLSGDEVVTTYEIITNNKTQNARDTIQRALRYARNNASENDIYTVRLPKGTYYFYSSLDIYSNTVFDLNGSVVMRAGNCSSLIRFGEKNDVSYGYNGYKNITIKNGTFDGNRTGNTSLIRFAHAENIKIDNVTFTNTKGVMHLLTFAASNNVSVTDCTFSDMTITKNIEKFNCEALQIDILKKGHFNYPAQDGTPSKNITVSGCTFENLQRGVGTHSAFQNHYFDNIKITGNTFKNIEGYAINAINYTNSVLSDNIIENCSSGINCSTITNYKLAHFYGPVNESDLPVSVLNTVIKNNTISLSDNDYEHIGYGINIAGQNIKNYTDKDGKKISGDYRISGVSAENNTITSKVSAHNFYGIQIEGAVGKENGKITVKSNKINISCNNTAVKANYGIRITDSLNVDIEGNTVADNGTVVHLESGIRLESSEGCRIIKNTITNTTSFGIKLTSAAKSVVSENTLNKIASDGIYIFSKSDNVSITDNALYSPKGHGIYARDSKLSDISSNKIYTPNDHGIYVTGTAFVKNIYNNLLSGINSHGIYLNKDASADTILSNKVDIINKSAVGIYLINNASAGTIDKNLINTNESKSLTVTCKNGITVNSKKCALKSLSSNTVKGCTDNAIVLFALKSDSKPKINSNTVIMGKGMGIYISNSTAVKSVSYNYICGATAHGIYLNKSASASTIKGNTIDIVSNKASGIKIFDKANAVSVTSNIINAGEKEESKSLKLSILTGIEINSKSCKLKSIKNNTVKNPSDTGIVLYGIKSDASPSISGNTVIKPKKGIYLTNSVKCSSISSNYICGSREHGIYLNKTASASSISKNTIDVISKSASGIYLIGDSSVKKINSNTINAKKKAESKKLKVNCTYGICINSKSCKISEIKSNTVKKSSNTAICIYQSKTKPTVTKNTVSNSPYGIRYKKATVKSNTFTKCSKAKTKKL